MNVCINVVICVHAYIMSPCPHTIPTPRDLGEDMTDDELQAMIDEFDKDGDGESM